MKVPFGKKKETTTSGPAVASVDPAHAQPAAVSAPTPPAEPEAAVGPLAPEPLPAPAGPPSPAESAPPREAQADAATREVDDLRDRLLRLQADFENYRKRVLRDRTTLAAEARQEFMIDLLPALDHLALAIRAAREATADNPFVQGFLLVGQQLAATLEKHGLSLIDVPLGQPFDPARHEAVSHIPSSDVPENVVIAETRRGYTLCGRLLRAAQVAVSSGPTTSGKAEDADRASRQPAELQPEE
jgi:molecular chaperone GrpE